MWSAELQNLYDLTLQLINIGLTVAVSCLYSESMASVNMIFLLVSLFVSLATFDSDSSKMKTLFDFTSETDFTQTEANLWHEVSDTVR